MATLEAVTPRTVTPRTVGPDAPTPVHRRAWSPRTSFRLVVATQALLLAASNFPTPLFPIYERRYGFSSSVVTMLFGVYVLALVPTLLTLGRLADRVGRRPLLVSGIAITAVSSAAFAAAHSVAWLFAGEIIYGVGGGLVMSCVAVTIRELHPAQDIAGGARASTLAAAGGLAVGPLLSGALATVTPWPTVSPYLLDMVAAVLVAVALARIPETRPVRSTPVVRPRLLHVPVSIRRPFVTNALAGAAAWMTVGWIFGLSPSFLHEELGVHVTQPVVAGLFAALAIASNGTAQIVFRNHNTMRSLRLALLALLGGFAVMAASTLIDALGIAIVGAVLAGAGVGVLVMNTMSNIQHIAPVDARGGVTSAFLTVCYIAMSVPVLIAGFVADGVGLGRVTALYLAALAILVVAAFTRRR